MEKINFKISSDIYPLEKERANKETVWEHYFARKIAFLLAPIFLKIKVSANQISLLAIVIGIAAAILIIVGDFWIVLLGAILMQFWLILDKVDGVIARYKKTVTAFGKFLEELQGSVIAALFFSSIGVAASKFPGFLPSFCKFTPQFFIILGALTSLFVILRHLVFRHFEVAFSREKEIKSEALFNSGRLSTFYKIAIKFLGVYSLAQPIFILAVIFNFLGFYTLIYCIIQGVAMLANVIFLVYRAAKI